MNQIKKFQKGGVGKTPTFYSGLPVSNEQTIPGETIYDNGSDYGYRVFKEVNSDGSYTVSEDGTVVPSKGFKAGVNASIVNYYDKNGNMTQPGDTTLYGYVPMQRPIQEYYHEDPEMYQQLNNEFQQALNQANAYVANRTAPMPNKYTQRNTLPEKRQGGYLRLQKQGGKLTEVWTPFN